MRAIRAICVLAAVVAGAEGRRRGTIRAAEPRAAPTAVPANGLERALADPSLLSEAVRHMKPAAGRARAELAAPTEAALLEVSASPAGERGECEMCMFALHESQLGRLPPCGGSTTPTYSSWMCVQVVRSMLRFADDIMSALKNGCYRYDPLSGWETEKPCSSHAICGRLVNAYSLQRKTMCPPDPHYKFHHRQTLPAPHSFNPLLPYAIKWYRDLNASSVAQDASSGAPW